MLQAGLKVIGGKHHGKIISLSSNRFIIGREQDCHLRPNSELVSRHHCVFNLDEYALQLRDLGSTNGTFVNGERIKGRVMLKSGDRVHVGKLEFEVILKEVANATSPSLPVPDDQSALSWETEELSASETTFDMPAINPTAQGDSAVFTGNTTVQSSDQSSEPPALDQPTPAPAMPTAAEPEQQPPAQPVYEPATQQQAYPPQPLMPQWPQQMPQYQQPGQPVYPGMPMMPGAYYPPNPYPQGMPGAYPLQPMPGGYPQAMPQPGMPLLPDPSHQQQTPGGSIESEPESRKQAETLPVNLPDPSATGVKDEPKAAEGEEKVQPRTKEEPVNPSNKAADIIKQYMQRRPDA